MAIYSHFLASKVGKIDLFICFNVNYLAFFLAICSAISVKICLFFYEIWLFLHKISNKHLH